MGRLDKHLALDGDTGLTAFFSSDPAPAPPGVGRDGSADPSQLHKKRTRVFEPGRELEEKDIPCG